MDKISRKFCLLTFSCLILFSACKNNKDAKEVNNITYDTITVLKVYHLDNDPSQSSYTLDVKYTIPSNYENKDVLAKIQRELNSVVFEEERYTNYTPQDAAENYALDCINNYKDQASFRDVNEEIVDGGEEYPSYNKILRTEILFNQAKLISYQVSSEDTKSIGESFRNFRTIVFDLNTGNLLTEDDIFLNQYESILSPILKTKIMAQKNIKESEDLIDLGYWGIEDITPNNNFYVNEKGITYIFNEGEYAARAIKEIRVFIPYDEIDNILKHNSPISILTGV